MMTDEQIDAIAASMPDGAGGMLTQWDYRQFARAVADHVAEQKWPTLSDLHLRALMLAYNEGYSKAIDGRKFKNPFSPEGSQAAAWALGTADGAEARGKMASAPVADESPMAKMADALREKARQEQQTYQDRRAQATEWGPLPEGTEADLLTRNAPVAHVAGDETSRYLDWAKDRSAWEMPVGTPVYYSALASTPVVDERRGWVNWTKENSGLVADFVADNWPMKKYTLAEIEQRLRDMFMPPPASAPVAGHQPYPAMPEPDVIAYGEAEDSYSRSAMESAMRAAHDRGYSVGWDHGKENASAPVAGEAVAAMVSAKPLEPEFAKVLADNFYSLVLRSDAAPQASVARHLQQTTYRLDTGPTEPDNGGD